MTPQLGRVGEPDQVVADVGQFDEGVERVGEP